MFHVFSHAIVVIKKSVTATNPVHLEAHQAQQPQMHLGFLISSALISASRRSLPVQLFCPADIKNIKSHKKNPIK